MVWLDKPWGRYRETFRDDRVQIVECEIKAGGSSSLHKHMRKDNTFLVVSGELVLEMHPSSLRSDTHVLTPNDGPATVLPCVPHRFRALQATRLIEIYRATAGFAIGGGPNEIGEDIVRISDGGPRT